MLNDDKIESDPTTNTNNSDSFASLAKIEEDDENKTAVARNCSEERTQSDTVLNTTAQFQINMLLGVVDA